MWRKSRHNHATLCYGTDLNRNFDFHWMEMGGASQNPCDETYAGPKPLSDVESQHLARFVEEHAAQTKLYLAFHSYGQYVLFPYGHTKVAAPNHSVLVGSIGITRCWNYVSFRSCIRRNPWVTKQKRVSPSLLEPITLWARQLRPCVSFKLGSQRLERHDSRYESDQQITPLVNRQTGPTGSTTLR